MATRQRAAQSSTEPDPEAGLLAEPPPPAPFALAAYIAVYGIYRDSAYLPPGAVFYAYPSDPRVLAGQARPVLHEPTAEQAAALAAAVAAAES